MKKRTILYAAGLMLFFSSLSAQITLTGYTFSSWDTANYTLCDTASFAFPQVGANHTWDYSSLDSTGSAQIYFGTDLSKSAQSSSYPTANILIKDPLTESFYKNDANSFEQVGLYVTAGGQPYGMTYSNNETSMEFPTTYQDIITDSYARSYSILGINYFQSGAIRKEAVGFGSLKIPGVDISDVLLIKETRLDTITSVTDTVFTEGILYKFHDSNIWYPRLYFGTSTRIEVNGSTTNSKSIVYTLPSQISTSIRANNENPNAGFSLYPIPAQNRLYIKGIPNKTVFEVFDLQGKLLLNGRLAEGTDEIDIEKLDPGVYVIQIRSNEKIQNMRFVKESMVH